MFAWKKTATAIAVIIVAPARRTELAHNSTYGWHGSFSWGPMARC
jgi:hypothetical protein